jgi:glycine/sarcosine N-methyltransferase
MGQENSVALNNGSRATNATWIDRRKEQEMNEQIEDEYNLLAPDYDEMFADWNALNEQKARMLSEMIEAECGNASHLRVLETACGIGTLAGRLAARGYRVTACDFSAGAIARARRETRHRETQLQFEIGDMRDLTALAESGFDVVACLGNSFCVFGTPDELSRSIRQLRMKVRAGGLLIAGVRDYAPAMLERPLRIDEPMCCFDNGKWRFVRQIWQWLDETHYISTVCINGEGSVPFQRSVHCRAVLPEEMTNALHAAGFVNVRWTRNTTGSAVREGVYESGFDQLIVSATSPFEPCNTGEFSEVSKSEYHN